MNFAEWLEQRKGKSPNLYWNLPSATGLTADDELIVADWLREELEAAYEAGRAERTDQLDLLSANAVYVPLENTATVMNNDICTVYHPSLIGEVGGLLQVANRVLHDEQEVLFICRITEIELVDIREDLSDNQGKMGGREWLYLNRWLTTYPTKETDTQMSAYRYKVKWTGLTR